MGPPGPPGGFVIGVGKTSSAYPLIRSFANMLSFANMISFANMHSSDSLPFHLSIDSGRMSRVNTSLTLDEHGSRANSFTRRYSLPFRT